MIGTVKYIPSGDSAIIIKVGEGISYENHIKVRTIFETISALNNSWINECIPSYNEVLVQYDPVKVSFSDFLLFLKSQLKDVEDIKQQKKKIIEVPVVYGGEFGPDIENVSRHAQLSVDEVIELHTKPEYLVYMLGFTPGFCYLGGLDKKIATPRLDNPRTKIPRGSVGIAGDQTGIYPIESPGGWQLIGRTPLLLFYPDRKPEFLFEAGNYLKFIPIDKTQYYEINEELAEGSYVIRTIEEEG
jgi:inhibitor of KinA